jgi:hypothetical protein
VGPAALRSRLVAELKLNLDPKEIDILIAKFDEKGTGLINISESESPLRCLRCKYNFILFIR